MANLRALLGSLALIAAVMALPAYCLAGETVTINMPGGPMTFVQVAPGTFAMGGNPYIYWHDNLDAPAARRVTITKAFYLSTREITQAQWNALVPEEAAARGDSLAMRIVREYTSAAVNIPDTTLALLMQRLSALSRSNEPVFRLPTEAEWEYACRAGTDSPFWYPDTTWEARPAYELSFSSFGGVAGVLLRGDAVSRPDWSQYGLAPVRDRLPNPWGFYDMHGSVHEWTQDWYAPPDTTATVDPVGPAANAGYGRVLKGGSAVSSYGDTRSAARTSLAGAAAWAGEYGWPSPLCGARLVMIAPPSARANSVPLLTGHPNALTIREGEECRWAVSAVDWDGDSLYISLPGVSPGLAVTRLASNQGWLGEIGRTPIDSMVYACSDSFAWTPGYDQGGTYDLVFQVRDSRGAVDTASARVVVLDANRPPEFTPPLSDTTGVGGVLSLDLAPYASDPDGDSLMFAATGLPAGASLVGSLLYWRPGIEQAGRWDITLSVHDGAGGSDAHPFAIIVTDNPWSIAVTATSHTGARRYLRFGTASGATPSLDPSLGEVDLPPLPPPTVFDARFAMGDSLNGSLTDLRPTTTTKATWILDLQPGTAGMPMVLAWDLSALPSSAALQIRDWASGGNLLTVDMARQDSLVVTDLHQAKLEIVFEALALDFTYVLPVGWSMVSMPFRPDESVGSTPLTGAISLFRFADGYQLASSMAPGVGYWVNLPASLTRRIGGAAYQAVELQASLPAGWAMIGPGDAALSVDQMRVASPMLISAFGFSGQYEQVTILQPGKAYWVNMDGPGVLDLVGKKAAAKPGRPPGTLAQVPGEVRLWAVGSGFSRALELGVPRPQVVLLPPLPPSGAFDARGSLGKGQTAWQLPDENGVYPLQMQGVDTLRWQASVADRWVLSIDGQETPLAGQGCLALAPLARVRLVRRALEPLLTSLARCYPNPFNPTTVIDYDLATAAEVRLRVFSVTGQCVRELVAARQAPGSYHVTWDGRDDDGVEVSSGVFLCELRADQVRAIRRLVRLR